MEPDKMRADAAELGSRALDIGNAFRQFGAAFASPSWRFEVRNDEIVGHVTIPEIQGVKPVVLPLAYLDKERLVCLIRDIEESGTQAAGSVTAAR